MNFALIKDHPYATGTVIIAGGVVAFMLFGSGGGSGGAASNGVDPQLAAISAQLQDSADNRAFQLNMLGAKSGAQMAMAQLSAQTSLQYQSNDLTAQLASLQVQAGVQSQSISASKDVQLAQLSNSLEATKVQAASYIAMAQVSQQTAIDLAVVNAQMQTSLANINADVYKTGIIANRDIAITQSNAFASVARQQIKSNNQSGWMGAVVAVAGMLI